MARDGFFAPERAEERHAAGADEDHEAEKLAGEFLVVEHDQERTEQDADHQEEYRAPGCWPPRSGCWCT